MALLVLSALTTLCLQFFAAASDQRRQVFAHLTATQEAANMLERAEALGWNELTTAERGQIPAFRPGPADLARGDATRCSSTSLPARRRPSGWPPAVRWRPQPGEPEREVRLVAWRYKKP